MLDILPCQMVRQLRQDSGHPRAPTYLRLHRQWQCRRTGRFYLVLSVFAYSEGMDTRHNPRVVTDHYITCRALGRDFSVLMYDLSTGGCMFESARTALAPGVSVTIIFPSDPEAPATVVWAAGKCVGVKFGNDIETGTVENYGYRLRADAFDATSPRDRSGRILPALTRHSA